MLNREFTKKDVNRMRNLITGDTHEKTSDIIGYKNGGETHKEGDVWESNGKKWIFKDGVIQNITRLDSVKNLNKMPLFCPKCSKPMKNRNDKTFYPIHKMCFDCLVIFESNLRIEGKWEEYEKEIHNSEIDARISEFNYLLDNALDESNKGFITEDGKMEKWDGKVNKEQVEEYRKAGIEYFNSLKR